MLSVEMLPAGNGDGLWIEYGSSAKPKRILIDGGTRATQTVLIDRINALPPDDRRFELMVLTHVDMDHIGGMLRVWQKPDIKFNVAEFWMNGRGHLDAPDVLGACEGEELTRIIASRSTPWNEAFARAAVVVPHTGPLPSIKLGETPRVTLLSPYFEQLQDMIPEWDAAIEELEKETTATDEVEGAPPDLLGGGPNVEELAEVRTNDDTAKPNGSSIAFLLEHDGTSILFGADAFPAVVQRSLERLIRERGLGRLKIDAYKVAHHGSRANNNTDLLSLLDCPKYLFSTNGVQTKHPHPETIAKILKNPSTGPKKLVFNYRTTFNEIWDDAKLMQAYDYSVEYSTNPAGGIKTVWR